MPDSLFIQLHATLTRNVDNPKQLIYAFSKSRRAIHL